MPITSFANVVAAHWTRGLLAALVLLAVLVAGLPRLTVQGGHGADIVVNDIGPGADATGGAGTCEATANGGDCTLSAAVQTAQVSAGPDTITFASPLFDTPQTITLVSTVTDITEDLTITGPGAGNLDIQGGAFRHFTITGDNTVAVEIVALSLTGSTAGAIDIRGKGNPPTVMLTDLVIDGNTVTASNGGGIRSTGANLTITNSTIANNMAANGGGIHFTDGTLTITNSTIANNTAVFDGGGVASVGTSTLIVNSSTIENNTAGSGHRGGGIFNGGTLTITNSTIAGNTANDDGGGIWNVGTLTITNSTIANNTANDDGGGIFNDTGNTLTITNSTIANNTANDKGGGIFIEKGPLTITNSTIAGNTAVELGGGIFNSDDDTLTITNSTIANNTADLDGGGIYNDGTLTITNSTIANNTADDDGGGIFNGGFFNPATLTLNSTIVATNTATNGPDIFNDTGFATIDAVDFSLIGDNTDSDIVGGGNNIVGKVGSAPAIDPLLGPLQNNGGPTETLALLPTSPAIDTGDDPLNLGFDQRGDPFARVVNGGTSNTADIGAFEFGATVTLNKAFVPADDAGTFDLTVTGSTDGVDQSDLFGPQNVNFAVAATPTVSEAATGGAVLADYTTTLTCIANGTVVVGSLPSGVTTTSVMLPALPAGADILCTFTNTRLPRVTVNKAFVPVSDAGTFDLTVTGSTDGVDQSDLFGPQNVNFAVAATPTVSEAATGGAVLADYTTTLTCVANGAVVVGGLPSGMTTTSMALPALPAGADILCTFTNTRLPRVTVNKAFVPVTDSGAFTLGVDSTLDSVTTVDLLGPQNVNVALGATPIVSEIALGTNLSDYATTLSCVDSGPDPKVTSLPSGVTTTSMALPALPAGADILCTFTNTRLPRVTVNKAFVPVSDAGTFDLTVTGSTDGVDQSDLFGPQNVNFAVDATPTVSEAQTTTTNLSDYATTLSCVDSGPDPKVTSLPSGVTTTSVTLPALPAGADILCTFTNTRLPRVTVDKIFAPADDAGTFDLSVDATSDGVTTTGPDLQGPQDVNVALGATPTVSEAATGGTVLADYTTTLTCVANGAVVVGGLPNGVTTTSMALPALSAGADILCTLTNTFVPPTVGAPPPTTQSLTVTKIVVNTGGGTLGVADFPLWIDGNATTSGQAVSVSADTHTVSETGADNYDAVISGDCDVNGAVTVASGGASSCTITNTFVPSDDPAPDPLPPLPDLIFTDGFESGDTSVWTDVDRVPGPSSDSYQNGGGTNSSGLRTAQGAAVPIADAVASIVGDYDAIFVYDPTINAVNLSDNFLVYRPEPALAFLNTLTELRSGQAYFIFNSDPDGIVWEQGLAIVEARSVALVSGFNYVGWSGPELAPLADATAGISADVFSAFLWDAEAQEYLVYWRDAPSALNLNTFDDIPFARGLWLLMDQATTWLQPARDG